jgi:transcriptional regulator with XRE-family HTH domain
MPLTPATVRKETDRRLRRARIHIGEEIRRLRLDADLTLTEVAAVAGIHRSYLTRIEDGTVAPSLEVLIAIGVVLGADLGVRYFAGAGPRLVDRFQAPMEECFIPSLHQRWSVRLEVGVTTPARGVVDMVLTDRSSPITAATEFQSTLHRVEQQIRWLAEKADGLAAPLGDEAGSAPVPTVSKLLVLRSTMTTREIARRYEAILRTAYPARTVDVLAALTTGAAPWPGAGIVWMRVESGRAVLLDGAPRGVRLGRWRGVAIGR